MARIEDGVSLVSWAPKLPRQLILRLYTRSAHLILDDDLIDEVGYRLLERCRSIEMVTAAHRFGRVTCPRCSSLVIRDRPLNHRAQLLKCAYCGWSITWGAYFATYQGKQLTGGSALPAFSEFCHRFAGGRTPEERLVAIDRLINTYHHELKRSTRPAAAHLIEGTPLDVLTLLDSIADMGGPEVSPTEMARRRDAARRAELGERLRQLRVRRRLAGRQVADLVGTTTSRICLLETGRIAPPNLVGRIARALGADSSFVQELVAAAEVIRSARG